MSFSGFVFDMIRRDKENRDMRNLRRERHNERLGKIHKGRMGMPQNTTAEDLKEIAKLTTKKEQSEQRYHSKMTMIILCICFVIASLAVYLFIH